MSLKTPSEKRLRVKECVSHSKRVFKKRNLRFGIVKLPILTKVKTIEIW